MLRLLRLLPQVKNLEDAQQGQALLPRLFSSKGTDLQWLKLVSHLHHLKICLCPHKLHCQHSSQHLLNASPAQLWVSLNESPSSHSTYKALCDPRHLPPSLPQPLPGFSSCLPLCSTSTSHSAPATAASSLLLKHGIKSSPGTLVLSSLSSCHSPKKNSTALLLSLSNLCINITLWRGLP